MKVYRVLPAFAVLTPLQRVGIDPTYLPGCAHYRAPWIVNCVSQER